MFLIPFIAIFAAIIGYLVYKNYKLEYKRSALLSKYAQEAPKLKDRYQQVQYLYQHLNENQLDQLFKKAIVFIYEKNWSNQFNDHQKACEAVKACIPLLNRSSNFYPSIDTIEDSRTFQQWLKFHERQFEVEKGKLNLKEFRGNFTKCAQSYILQDKECFSIDEKKKELLSSYFGKF